MPKRQLAFKVGFAVLALWGLVEIGIAISEHGLTLSRDLGTGIAWLTLGVVELIWGGRRFSADDRPN
ncbi:MAG: hypothetical protein H6916_11550 [Novosphingobium sp.]|uniref:hypothetical protein n=1 Tax=Novosphingobium sp. TaxID=1874826 RepID=UPI0026182D73|nr:hypothetical protein [Novosphingobium sp.]MCP5387428.1 hypothetical protein [Novosphingobium sp.]